MDSIIDLLITIAVVALFSLPSLLKKKKEAQAKRPVFVPNPEYDEPEEVYESAYEEVPQSGDFVQKTAPEVPKREEYFTYETIEPEVKMESKQAPKAPPKETQQPENKGKEEGLLSFEEDEVLKGVVYSEILKRKF